MCIFVSGSLFYLYIDKQNDLTELKMHIPKLVRNLKVIEEENAQLRYEVEKMEDPQLLMELLRLPEFSHLKYPSSTEVIQVNED